MLGYLNLLVSYLQGINLLEKATNISFVVAVGTFELIYIAGSIEHNGL